MKNSQEEESQSGSEDDEIIETLVSNLNKFLKNKRLQSFI